MSFVDKIYGLVGKKRGVDANIIANRARQQTLHGQGLDQTSGESSSTRTNMEAELDRQRADRAKPAE